MRLQPSQLQAFLRDGLLHLPAFLVRESLERLREWTDEVQAWPETAGAWMQYFEISSLDGRRQLNRLENFCPYHPGFRELVEGPLCQIAGELLGEPAVLFKDKMNFKLPGGDGFGAHQDVQAGWDAYASLHLTAMVAVDRAGSHNGGLEVVRGRHQEGLLGRMLEPLDGRETMGMEFEPLPCEPGDALFFDSFVPHRSAPNLSGEPRRILYVTYNRASEGDHRKRYFADKRRGFPPDCERDPGKAYRFRV